MNKQKYKEKKDNLYRRVVSLWASASFVGIGPSAQVARWWSVTKEWKVLLAKERACWMQFR